MFSVIKKIAWYLIVASIAVAIYNAAGGIQHLYPWLLKESNKAHALTTKLDKKYVSGKLKPLKPLPIFTQLPGSHH